MKRSAFVSGLLLAAGLVACEGSSREVGIERSAATAPQPDSRGTEFWLMFDQNVGTPQLTLFISGETATTGTVAIPGLSFSQPFSVTPGVITSVPLPETAAVNGSGVFNSGIHVTAGAEVTVYGLNRVQYTTDAFLGLPTDILGTDYVVLGFGNTLPGSGLLTQLGVAAIADHTSVTITPTVATGGHPAGAPFTIVLDAGQVAQFQNGVDLADLSGSLITSDQPVAVFGGNQCTRIPDQNYVACDHVVEQLPPTTTWGRRFLTMPLATRLRGDTFRFLAATDGTQVSINGGLVANLNRGHFHQRIVDGPAVIEANNPILVAQYSNSSTYDLVTSDPFMMLVPPFEQFLASYTVSTPASGFRANYINVVAPAAVVGTLALDGAAVPAASFTPIGTSGFSGAQLAVGLGTHNLSARLPFGAFVYGFDAYDSYGYPGGMSLSKVAVVTTVTVAPADGTATVGDEYCVDATVHDQDGVAVPGVRVDFAVAGANTLDLFAEADAAGVAHVCYAGENPGADAITAAVGTISGSATVTWRPKVPVVSAGGPYTIDEGGQMKLSPTTTLQGVLSWEWDLNGDGRIDDFTQNAWFNAALVDGPKAIQVKVTVRNDLGEEASDTTTVNVVNAPPRGNFYVSSQYRPEGSTFSLTLSGLTDPAPADRSSLRFAFDCGEGTFGPLGTVRPVTCRARDDGILAVRARIVDKDGGETVYTEKVTVYNKSPTITITSPFGYQTFAVGERVPLQVAFQDVGVQDTHACAITWGDGGAGAGDVAESAGTGACAADHAYASAGTFKIIVNVADDDGGDATKLVYVIVK